MLRLYFCRHGESEGNATWIYASRTHVPLTSLGCEQADAGGKQALHDRLHIDLMLVSPLRRAQQTADILAPFLGNPPREDYDEIMERDFSPLDGTSYEDRDFEKYIALDKITGVESTAELQKRAEKVLAYLKQRPEENILLVSHSAFGRALIRAIHDTPWQQEYEKGFNTPLPHAKIIRDIIIAMSKPDIERLLEFQRLLLAFNQVDRMVHRKHGERFVYENDTEHSYNLAMTAWFIAEYFPQLNREFVIRYALVHDLVEVHAGDTYIYGSQAELNSKQEREEQALMQLRTDWSDFPSLTKDIAAYESRENEEAKFVYALDKIMPILQIYIHDGHTWKQEGITAKRLDSAKRDKVALSPEIDAYYQQLYALLVKNEHLFKP